ncbi:MAG: toprim domain-containing protein, partial [Halobacteriales archaeon]|nr:toprim domain-containing protein [Halobacteriales archaeon]
MNRVLVVESGAKTRTIKSFLGGDYDVVASGGHIVDLPDDELGIDVEGDFSFRVQPIPRRGGGDAVESMRDKLDGADEVYLATDPDREGEAIAADIREHALPPGVDVHRIEFNAIVYPVVVEALENPRDVNEDRVEAPRARRTL